jgi:hypothetical protein
MGLLPAATVGAYFAVWLFNSLMPLVPNADIDPWGELATIAKFMVGTVSFLCVGLWIAPHQKLKTLVALSLLGISFFAIAIWHLLATM